MNDNPSGQGSRYGSSALAEAAQRSPIARPANLIPEAYARKRRFV
jgi:hypothetical protein